MPAAQYTNLVLEDSTGLKARRGDEENSQKTLSGQTARSLPTASQLAEVSPGQSFF